MKKYLFIFFFAILLNFKFVIVDAQTTIPFPSADAHWCESSGFYDGVWQYNAHSRYSIRTDTVITGNTYQIINNTSVWDWFQPAQPWITYCCDTIYEESFAYLRNVNNNIYRYDWNTANDFLLYDFNIALYDTLITYHNTVSTQNKITNIDSIFDGNQYRKRWWLTLTNNNPPLSTDSNFTYIIDGIGSGFGLFGELYIPFEHGSTLNCYRENNGFSYAPNGFCDCLTLSINELTKYSFEVFPNPNNGNFTLWFSVHDKPGWLDVYDVNGNLILHEGVAPWSQYKQVDLKAAPSGRFGGAGIYFCKMMWGSIEQSVKVITTP